MSADTLRAASAVHPIAAMQTEYSAMTRNPEIAVLEACRELGTTFVAFSPVARGMLAGGYHGVEELTPKDLRHTMPRFTGENWAANAALVAAFDSDCSARRGDPGATLARLGAVARGARRRDPGTSRIDHLEENIARWDWEIPAAWWPRSMRCSMRQTVAGERYSPVMQKTIDTEVFA